MAKKTTTTTETSIVGGLTQTQIKDYADFFHKNKLDEFIIEEGGVKISMKQAGSQPMMSGYPIMQSSAPVQVQAGAPAQTGAVTEPIKTLSNENLKKVVTPFAGTFYASQNPDAAPFVKVGDSIKADTVIGIVEAMKVMNEITAGVSGKIVEIIISNGDSVSSNQPIMYVE